MKEKNVNCEVTFFYAFCTNCTTSSKAILVESDTIVSAAKLIVLDDCAVSPAVLKCWYKQLWHRDDVTVHWHNDRCQV